MREYRGPFLNTPVYVSIIKRNSSPYFGSIWFVFWFSFYSLFPKSTLYYELMCLKFTVAHNGCCRYVYMSYKHVLVIVAANVCQNSSCCKCVCKMSCCKCVCVYDEFQQMCVCVMSCCKRVCNMSWCKNVSVT